MIEKIGKQENLPENMGIIPILKMKKVFFVFLYSFTLNRFYCRRLVFDTIYFSRNFSLTESDTVGPQLFTWSKKISKLSHQSAEIIFFH